MKLIDTHCHIYSIEFDTDRVAMLSRAEHEGISKMLMPAIDISTHVQMLRLENEFPDKCMSMMGLHPCSIKENYREELQIVQEYFQKRSFKAVGETGLDFYWDLTYTKEQYEAFQRQIELALQHDIPIVIHSRNSTDECIEMIPYLAPVPFRGKRNECSYLKYVAEKLAEVKNIPVEEIAAITTANAERLFNL